MQKYIALLILMAYFFLGACQTAIPEPPPTPTDVPVAIVLSPTPQEADYCVSCHTDKEQLISTAKPVEVAESESKGIG